MQPPEVFYKKSCSEKFRNIHMKKRLLHSCFPVNIAKFSRTSISKNICQRHMLTIVEKLSIVDVCEFTNWVVRWTSSPQDIYFVSMWGSYNHPSNQKWTPQKEDLISHTFSYQISPNFATKANNCFPNKIRDHPLSTYAKFSEKLIFLTP